MERKERERMTEQRKRVGRCERTSRGKESEGGGGGGQWERKKRVTKEEYGISPCERYAGKMAVREIASLR